MPNGNGAVMAPTKRDLATLPLGEAIELFGEQLEAALPPDITIAHFKRMLITAVNINPKLKSVDRRTFFNEAIKCASDGLLPDGREAVINPFEVNKKRDGAWTKVLEAKYQPMIAGIRKRMRNSGEVVSAVAEVVYRNDTFHYRLGDAGNIEHEPPPLDEDRGDPVGAYAIIRLKSGEVVREVMSRKQIEKVRDFSPAYKLDTTGTSPWKRWPDEMWRKTVLRRCSKQAPQAATLAQLLSRDDDEPRLIGPPSPRPRREDFLGYADDDGEEVMPNTAGHSGSQPHNTTAPVEAGADPDDLPPHIMEREPPEDDGYDADTGEVAEDDPGERDPFWSGEHLVVVVHRTNNRADWDGAKTALLSRIAEARSVAELSRLEADNKSTINSVGLAIKSTVVATAIKTRMAELRRVDTAGNPLSALDAG